MEIALDSDAADPLVQMIQLVDHQDQVRLLRIRGNMVNAFHTRVNAEHEA